LTVADGPGSPAHPAEPGASALELHPEPFESLEDDWVRLGVLSGNVFGTWEWASVWWRHFGGGRPALTVAARDASGHVAAILPLYLGRDRPVRVARFIGHGAGDELGPVCEAGDPRGEAALRQADGEWDVLLAERLRGSGYADRLGGRLMGGDSSPVIELPEGGWDGYLASRSSNFRSQVRRKERKLIREHGLSYRLSDDPERLDQDLSALFELHHARWAGGSSGALAGSRDAFHREFATVAQERGWLRLWLAEIGGRPVAAWYGFRFGGADWYYQFGRDPSWDKASLGLVLLAHTVRDAIESGQRQYRLLRGDESYKDRFATGDAGLETVALARSARGRMAVGTAAAGLAMPGPLRKRLVRAVG
jgi:CelD/BcsL family acetyltransferase involved in cellulose biosynthesis